MPHLRPRSLSAQPGDQVKILSLEKDVAKLTRELTALRAGASDDARLWQRRMAEAERRSEQLAEEGEALVLELRARPTLQEHRCGGGLPLV